MDFLSGSLEHQLMTFGLAWPSCLTSKILSLNGLPRYVLGMVLHVTTHGSTDTGAILQDLKTIVPTLDSLGLDLLSVSHLSDSMIVDWWVLWHLHWTSVGHCLLCRNCCVWIQASELLQGKLLSTSIFVTWFVQLKEQIFMFNLHTVFDLECLNLVCIHS